MKVLIDTPIWSLALRRRERFRNEPLLSELASLVADGRVGMIGPIRQEVLSGVKAVDVRSIAGEPARISRH